MEGVVFPHVILSDGSTYILSVHVDPCKGPNLLEGGQWQLEILGSGEVEVGAETMEQDLEELVRQSWVEPVQDEARPPRNERAALSRRKWLAERGLATPIDESESALPEEKVPDEKGKKGRGPSPPVPDQDLQAEAQALAA